MLSFSKIPVSERENALIQPHWLTGNKKPNLLTFERDGVGVLFGSLHQNQAMVFGFAVGNCYCCYV